jgi:polyisoprenoid-binding protein YceI
MRGSLSILLLAAAASMAGAQGVKMNLDPTSTIRVDGTSNVHDWHATSSQITASIQVASPIGADSRIESVTLSLPVTSLKSGKGGLDKNLYKALNAEKNPTITFVMTTYDAKETGEAVITGDLTVNGVTKPVTAQAAIAAAGKDGLKATGTVSMKMTDFGVKPVTALLGTIRTADAITVKFDLAGSSAIAVAQLPRE